MKIVDQDYACEIFSLMLGSQLLHCRLRIFKPQPDVQTVLVSDLSTARWSMPYLLEQLVTQIVQEFDLEPAQIIWIEYSTPQINRSSAEIGFSHITFEWVDGRAINPKRLTITPAMAQLLSSGPLEFDEVPLSARASGC